MLREPLDRLVSNTYYARHSYASGNAWTATAEQIVSLVTPGASACLGGQCSDCAICETVERSHKAYDNMYVRTLGGRAVWSKAAGHVTREDLHLAKLRLSQYRVVLILDDFDAHAAQLRDVLGWRVSSLGHENAGSAHTDFFSDEQLATLAAANGLDYELYCFAQQLAAARTGESLARLARYDTYDRAPRG